MKTINPYEGPIRVIKKDDRYYIIGCDYGYLHDILGSHASWLSYSGAYKAMKRLKALKGVK
jgi:hypothetical protein